MTPRELLYIEDALGHLKFLKTQCENAANSLTDPVLKQEAQRLANKNQQIFSDIYGLI